MEVRHNYFIAIIIAVSVTISSKEESGSGILHKDAISALIRAKSSKCRDNIKKIARQAQQNELYPQNIKPLCDFYQDLPYLGCFQDYPKNRIFKKGDNLKSINSPEECVRYCYMQKFPLAGLQSGRECFCGKAVDSCNKITEDKCDIACPGNATQKCGGNYTMNIYKTKFKHLQSLKDDDARVRIAYLFILHGRSLRQVYRLFKRLYHPDDFFYFHVDSRSEYMYDHLRELEKKGLKNIKVTENRFPTIWGGASLLKMLISSMQEMLELNWNMDFVINLSGSDYILKHPQTLKKFLMPQKGTNFVKSDTKGIDAFIRRQGLDKTFYECDYPDYHMYRLGPRTLPMGIKYDGGSDWFCLSKAFIEYIVHQKDALLTGLISLFNYTLLPAESFFHIALKNSRFCSQYNNRNNLRIINWRREIGCQCQHKSVDWCGCSPNVFKIEDLKEISKEMNGDKFFARKFDATIDMSVMNAIDQLIYGSDYMQPIFWINLWHHNYDLDNVNSKLAHKLLSKSFATLLEMTILYKDDRPNSLLVLYKDGEVEKEAQYATKPPLHIVSGDVISIGSNFDVKERIFRHILPIFDDEANPAVLIQPQLETREEIHTGTILWLSPSGKVVFADRDFHINLTANHHVVHFPPKMQLNSGLWTAIYFDFMQEVSSINFLIITDTKEESQVPLLDYEIGIISNSIQTSKPDEKTWLTSTFALQESCIVNQTCHDTTWSSKSPDFLSLIEL